MELVTGLIIWGLMCWGVGALASSRGRSGFGFFLLSFFFSPLLGLIVVLVMTNLTKEATKESAQRREDEQRDEERKREHEKQLESLRALTAAQSSGSAHQAPSSTSPPSLAEELTKLAALRDKGVLTADEFESQKKQLLGQM